MINSQIVKTAYANIYSEPSFNSEMVTQALFFESLKVVSDQDNWLEVSQWDGYKGYVHKFYLSSYDSYGEGELNLTSRYTDLYKDKNFETSVLTVPFGATVKYYDVIENGYKINIDSKEYYIKQLINSHDLSKRQKVLHYCKMLMGSPYLWGGKTPFGYDCSGLIQSIYKMVKINFKRDTSDQIQDSRFASISVNDAQAGDIVFFDFEGNGVDHVGIWYGDDMVVHCSGQVKVQSIHDDSNKKLLDYIIDIKSLDDFLDCLLYTSPSPRD